MPEIKTVDELKAAYPDFTKAIADVAAAAAQDAERKRIQDIEGVAIAGYEDIIKAAKFDKPTSTARKSRAGNTCKTAPQMCRTAG